MWLLVHASILLSSLIAMLYIVHSLLPLLSSLIIFLSFIENTRINVPFYEAVAKY